MRTGERREYGRNDKRRDAGTTEYEALKALADILGIKFPELKENR